LLLEVFTQRNFVADVFDRAWILLAKTAKSRFVPPFGGLRGNVRGLFMAHWKARGRLLNFFRQLSRLRRYMRMLVKIVVFERGWVTNLGGRRVPGLSRGVVCVTLRLAVLIYNTGV